VPGGEGGLEQAVLDGRLTAATEAPGLRVGDELELAATIQVRDPTLGDHAYGTAHLPVMGQPGTFRVRLLWPASRRLAWKATSDMTDVATSTREGQTELLYQLTNPASATLIDNAPPRLNRRRQIDFSDYGSWAELSAQLFPYYEKAATLAADSPVRQEAARIAARTPDAAGRAIAALQLVEQQIRYVYVGLDAGNLRPATADETWTRRFGDCKAKTVLLLALLRELGVSAEPALVNGEDGDGIDSRLTNPTIFDHVLVRATIDARTYWLDGTRLGDVSLRGLPKPLFRWALPVRARDAVLLDVPLEGSRRSRRPRSTAPSRGSTTRCRSCTSRRGRAATPRLRRCRRRHSMTRRTGSNRHRCACRRRGLVPPAASRSTDASRRSSRGNIQPRSPRVFELGLPAA